MNTNSPSCLLFDKLIKHDLTLAFAESLTAGNLTAEFIKNPGASQSLLGGVTAYSNKVKQEVLGVKLSTLNSYGAVSKNTVEEMVTGLNKIIAADVCAAVSGIAGPGGGSENKPLGTVHMAFLVRGKLYTTVEVFKGDREEIIKSCIHEVYSFLFAELERQLP